MRCDEMNRKWIKCSGAEAERKHAIDRGFRFQARGRLLRCCLILCHSYINSYARSRIENWELRIAREKTTCQFSHRKWIRSLGHPLHSWPPHPWPHAWPNPWPHQDTKYREQPLFIPQFNLILSTRVKIDKRKSSAIRNSTLRNHNTVIYHYNWQIRSFLIRQFSQLF